MNTYEVYLSRSATDHLRAELFVNAETPEAAKAKALAILQHDPEVVEFRFGSCGEVGDITADDVAVVPHHLPIDDRCKMALDGCGRFAVMVHNGGEDEGLTLACASCAAAAVDSAGFVALVPESATKLVSADPRDTNEPEDEPQLYPMTKRELATVLAALRSYQNHLTPGEVSDIADEAGPPLTDDEIDDLCESLNTTPMGFAVFEAMA